MPKIKTFQYINHYTIFSVRFSFALALAWSLNHEPWVQIKRTELAFFRKMY